VVSRPSPAFARWLHMNQVNQILFRSRAFSSTGKDARPEAPAGLEKYLVKIHGVSANRVRGPKKLIEGHNG